MRRSTTSLCAFLFFAVPSVAVSQSASPPPAEDSSASSPTTSPGSEESGSGLSLDEVEGEGEGEDESGESAEGALAVGEYPKVYAQRPLVLTRGKLRVDVAPTSLSIDNSGAVGGSGALFGGRGFTIGRFQAQRASQTVVGLTAGASFGVMDNLEAGAVLLPIRFAPDFDYGDIELFGKYRFLTSGDLEIGGMATMRLPTDTRFAVAAGAPLIYHVGPYMRVEGGAELELIFDDTELNLDIPVGFAYNLQPEIFMALRTGIFVQDFDVLAIPLGVRFGYTLAMPDLPQMDLIAGFEFPYFLNTEDGAWLRVWQLMLGANIFFDIPLG